MSIHLKNPHSTFIHIPKTGGESVSMWMTSHLNKNFRRGEKHFTYKEMKNKYGDLGFTWCVVRNPWDRMVSGYHYYVGKDARILRKNNIHSFEKFLKMNNWGKTLTISQCKFAPEKIDYVVRFENYKNDFKRIQKFYGIHKPLPRKNQSEHKHYSKYYTEQWMIDVVAKKFDDDIKRFGYEFTYK